MHWNSKMSRSFKILLFKWIKKNIIRLLGVRDAWLNSEWYYIQEINTAGDASGKERGKLII